MSLVNKNYCMSSYLALRYIESDDYNFYPNMRHKNFKPIPEDQRILVDSADDIDEAVKTQFDALREHNKKLGVMLSGGMDSAIVASYMSGGDAYTFRFLNGKFQPGELKRAEYYADFYKLNLHYVDINWEIVNKNLDIVMKAKAAPVHSIEPQIFQAALQAKDDGIDLMLIGESSDLIFGGMNELLSKDWTFTEFMKRYIFVNPEDVLKEPVSMQYVFEKYRNNNNIDFLAFMNDIFAIESSGSYMNAFNAAGMAYYDPYTKLKMKSPLNLKKIRSGKSKYLIRELMAKKYPDMQIPEKVPMPRPVDEYFLNWSGPSRPEFLENLDMNKFTGNQKWQLYCLEKFLNLFE